jgi:hypothetical protein
MVLLLWGVLSDERTGLSFVYAAGPCQRSLSRVRITWDSRPYFTVSDLRLSFSSPSTTRRVTVEVFDPASTRGHSLSLFSAAWDSRYIASRRIQQKAQPLYCWGGVFTAPLHRNSNSSIVVFVFISAGTCLLSRCLEMNYSGFQVSCHNTLQLTYSCRENYISVPSVFSFCIYQIYATSVRESLTWICAKAYTRATLVKSHCVDLMSRSAPYVAFTWYYFKENRTLLYHFSILILAPRASKHWKSLRYK